MRCEFTRKFVLVSTEKVLITGILKNFSETYQSIRVVTKEIDGDAGYRIDVKQVFWRRSIREKKLQTRARCDLQLGDKAFGKIARR